MSKKIDVRPIIINDEDYNEKTEPFTYNLPTINHWSVNNKTRDSSLNDHGIEFTNNSNYHSPSIKTEDDEYIFKSITLTMNIDYIDGSMNDLSNNRYGFLLKFEKKGFNSDRLYINLPFKLSNTTSPMINTIYENKDNEFCNESINLNKLIPPNEYISYFYKNDTNDNYEFITFKDTELEIASAFIQKFNEDYKLNEYYKSNYALKRKNDATFKVSNGIPIEDSTMTSLNSDGMDIYIDCEPVHEKVDNYEIIKPKDVYKLEFIDTYSKVGGYGKSILTMMIFIVLILFVWFLCLLVINRTTSKNENSNGESKPGNTIGDDVFPRMFYAFLKYILPFFIIVSFIIHSVEVFKTKEKKKGKIEMTYFTDPSESQLEISFMSILLGIVLFILYTCRYYNDKNNLSNNSQVFREILFNPFPLILKKCTKNFGAMMSFLFVLIVPTIIAIIMSVNQDTMFPDVDQTTRGRNIWMYWFNLIIIMIAFSIACNSEYIFLYERNGVEDGPRLRSNYAHPYKYPESEPL